MPKRGWHVHVYNLDITCHSLLTSSSPPFYIYNNLKILKTSPKILNCLNIHEYKRPYFFLFQLLHYQTIFPVWLSRSFSRLETVFQVCTSVLRPSKECIQHVGSMLEHIFMSNRLLLNCVHLISKFKKSVQVDLDSVNSAELSEHIDSANRFVRRAGLVPTSQGMTQLVTKPA